MIARHGLFSSGLCALVPAAAIAASGVGGVGCVAAHYSIIAIPLRPPTSITDAGVVAGTSVNHHAAVWSSKNGVREIPLPAGFDNSEANAVNEAGRVAGAVNDHDKSTHQAFLVSDNVFALLPGRQGRANDLNESGDVVGESILNGGTATVAVVWKRGVPVALSGCCGGSAKAINKQGDIAGDAYDEAGRYHAFLWTKAGAKVPIGPPDTFSSAIAINDLGHVVVQALPDSFLYSNGVRSPLELAPKAQSRARAINNCDVIVGAYGPNDSPRAFVWNKDRGFQDLTALIPSDSGWTLDAAMAINDRGEIVGRGTFKGAKYTGFMLRPMDSAVRQQ